MVERKSTLKEASDVVKSKKDLHEMLMRNGYYLPKRTSSVCTLKFYNGIIDGTHFCP